jgi:hypothetical protein
MEYGIERKFSLIRFSTFKQEDKIILVEKQKKKHAHEFRNWHLSCPIYRHTDIRCRLLYDMFHYFGMDYWHKHFLIKNCIRKKQHTCIYS